MGWLTHAAANSLEQHLSTFLLVKIYVHNFLLAKYSHLSGLEAIHYRYVNPFPTPSDMCGSSYLGLEAPDCFGGPSSAGGTCADQSIAAADTDRSCCCPSETGA